MKATPADQHGVQRAIDLAQSEIAGPDIPVGACVVSPEGETVAQASNRRVRDADPTAHAEVLVLRAAAATLGSWRLDGHTLFVSLEPCPMCAGAAVNARVARVVFGAWNPDYGACGSVWDLPRDKRLSHRPEVVGGVLDAAARAPLDTFFAARRDT
ncbi:nucleoside deaminase [Candidatus Nanopelagicales bacterium]|nr:nucleoside deaminase [Candidatus Nanopelagicales bacterium]